MSAEKTRTRSHEHALSIDATPQEVWKAITEARELIRWFPLESSVSPGPGGSITLSWGPDVESTNRIEIWEEARRLRHAWVEPVAGGAERRETAVDWFIEGKGGGTVLRLVHSGFSTESDWDAEYDATNRGWEFELLSLKHYLEHHRGEDRLAFWLRQPVAAAAEAVWERLRTGAGFLPASGTARAGEPYSLTLASGERLAGTVLIHTPPGDFAATAENLNRGLWRFACERIADRPEAVLWLSTWGVPATEVREVESRWRQMLAAALA